MILIGFVLMATTLACGFSSPTSSAPNPPPTSGGQIPMQTTAPLLPTQPPAILPSDTPDPAETPPPPAPETSPTESPKSPNQPPSTGPQCTTLQNLNLRYGPGLAYRDPIGTVLANTVVAAVGYAAQGIPGGSWVLIEDTANNQSGWISAGTDYVSCNVDLATLPTVAVAPPPTAAPPISAKSGNEGGNCGPDFAYNCEVIITTNAFVQFKLFKKDGTEITQDNGMENVSFIVRSGSDDGGSEVFSIVESAAAYCIFGGNGPCNGWVVSNGTTTWPNGTVVSGGEYYVRITASFVDEGSSDIVSWASGFTISLP